MATTSVEKSSEKLVAVLTDAILAKVRDPEMLAWLWPKVEQELHAFDAHKETGLFPGLRAKEMRELCAELDEAALTSALHATFDKAWAKVGPRPRPAAPAKKTAKAGKKTTKQLAAKPALAAGFAPALAAAGGGIASEFAQLSPFVRANVIDGIAAWPTLRDGMFATFGAPGKPSVAIPRINAYYATLVEANFPPVSGVAGRKSPVHPNLKTKLDAAVTLLGTKSQSAVLAKLKSAGGFAIRKNANDASKLSNHSFGWAIDLDPELNPNIPKAKLPLDLILKLTGVDLFGKESTRLRAPRPYDTTLPDVEVLSGASTKFVAAFKDMPALKAACGASITRLYSATLASAMLDQAFTFAAAGNNASLRSLLSGAGVPADKVNECAKFLKDAVAQFKLAKAPGVVAKVMGTSASVTKFGFFNMPAPLVAALIASDGAALFWLGSANGTKDYMHSELFGADQPDLF
jgi:hypothetical protein